MHKEHAVEMIESIIKETDLDPCTVKTTEDLEVLGLFNLSRVLFFKYFLFFYFTLFYSVVHAFADDCFDLRCWCA